MLTGRAVGSSAVHVLPLQEPPTILPVKVEPPSMETLVFPLVVSVVPLPQFQKEPPMMSPVKMIPSFPLMETLEFPSTFCTAPLPSDFVFA